MNLLNLYYLAMSNLPNNKRAVDLTSEEINMILKNKGSMCMCGCGFPAPIAKSSFYKQGIIKGYPKPCIKGHSTTKTYLNDEDKKELVENKSGLCYCGCGGKTNMATISRYKDGIVTGYPLKYIRGHAQRGKPRSLETKKKISRMLNKSNRNQYKSLNDNSLVTNIDGLCFCGCGEKTKVATYTDVDAGVIAGYPQKYVIGHNHRGSINSVESNKKRSVTLKATYRKNNDVIISPFIPDLVVRMRNGRWYCANPKNPNSSTTHAKAVYEYVTGETIPKQMRVHHKNGDPTSLEDDHIDNLMLVSNQWNFNCFPLLAKGFGVEESVVTDAYCSVYDRRQDHTSPLFFGEVCKELIATIEQGS